MARRAGRPASSPLQRAGAPARRPAGRGRRRARSAGRPPPARPASPARRLRGRVRARLARPAAARRTARPQRRCPRRRAGRSRRSARPGPGPAAAAPRCSRTVAPVRADSAPPAAPGRRPPSGRSSNAAGTTDAAASGSEKVERDRREHPDVVGDPRAAGSSPAWAAIDPHRSRPAGQRPEAISTSPRRARRSRTGAMRGRRTEHRDRRRQWVRTWNSSRFSSISMMSRSPSLSTSARMAQEAASAAGCCSAVSSRKSWSPWPVFSKTCQAPPR